MKIVFMISIIAFSLIFGGCVTNSIEIQAVRPWEGRYENTAAAQKAVEQIDFKKDKSVWILSPDTLKRAVMSAKGEK